MSLYRISELRDAQAKLTVAPPYDLIVGLSSDTKPSEDSAGLALKRQSRFFEDDTGLEFMWTGTEWILVESPETRLLREIRERLDELTPLMRQIRNATGKTAFEVMGDGVPAD